MPQPLKVSDRQMIEEFLRLGGLTDQTPSSYSFAGIFMWSSLYEISWDIFSDNLCIFFKDRIGCFMYLPPLGRKISDLALKEAFLFMDTFNKNPLVSRIENITESQREVFVKNGFYLYAKYPEYVYRRDDLIQLKGNRYKSQRWSYNYFVRNYQSKVRPFGCADVEPASLLYQKWAEERMQRFPDKIFVGMLGDSQKALEVFLDNYNQLGLNGIIVEIKGKMVAFSLGFALNKDTFCIAYEVADLSIKGLAAFVFREFCRLLDYTYINVMDDAGIEAIRRAKESYRPCLLLDTYVARRR